MVGNVPNPAPLRPKRGLRGGRGKGMGMGVDEEDVGRRKLS